MARTPTRTRSGRLRRAFAETLRDAGVRTPDEPGEPVTEDDVADLPDVVQRYLSFMGVVGRPRDRSVQARFEGRFRMKPDQRWMPAEAWQFTSGVEVARVYVMRLGFLGVVPMIGRDTYVGGTGRMVGKLLDLVTVAEGTGEEFDVGELTTYLNDALLLAPSMLLGRAAWIHVDEETFDVALTDAGRTVHGRVTVDEEGAPVDFATTDRFADLPGGLVRAEWHTPVERWEDAGGRPVPGASKATWHLDDGPFTYVEGRFVPETIRWNAVP
jgi:hypothetical protein